jgi:hypothetical protein
MPRLRGPAPAEPTGDAAWPILNDRLFGAQVRGGHSMVPDPAAVPVDWDAVFGELAERWPDHDHVGVELRRRFCWRLAQQMAAADGPRNVRLVWADAKLVIPAAFAPGSLQAIFINFPDPWWKRRHSKRRLVDLDFATVLTDRLALGGHVWVKSDVPAIAEEIREALVAVDRLGEPAPFGAASPTACPSRAIASPASPEGARRDARVRRRASSGERPLSRARRTAPRAPAFARTRTARPPTPR